MTSNNPAPKRNTSSNGVKAEKMLQEFRSRFGVASGVRIFQAPGRVNLIGEHTDYNDDFVMPAAIGFHTWIAAAPTSDKRLTIYSGVFDETTVIDLQNGAPAAQRHWSDYIAGVALELQRSGVDVPGTKLLVSGNIPMGAGLSSSASLEVATALPPTRACATITR